MAPLTEPPVNDAVFTLRADTPRLSIAADDAVTAVAAVGGLLWVGTSSGRLIRHDPASAVSDEVRGRLGVGRLDNAVWRIVADPHTRSALVILRNADGYHAHGTGLVRPRWLSRLRGLRCVSATWLRVPGPSGPRPLALVGTALGAVFSLSVDSKHERDDALSKLWNAPNAESIDGLRVEHVAGKFVAVVATASAMYVFSDALELPDLFADDRPMVVARPEGVPPQPPPTSDENAPPPGLQFMTGAAGAASRRFVWAGAAGVTHGQLAVRRRRHDAVGPDDAPRSAVVASVDDKDTVPWSTLRETAGAPAPLACNLSAFHALLLYPTSVYAFNHISGRLTQRVTLWSAGGPPSPPKDTRSDWLGASAAGSSIRGWRGVAFGASAAGAAGDAAKHDVPDAKRFLSSPAAGFARDVLDDVLWVYSSDGEFARLSASDEEQTEAWKAAKAMGRFELAMALAPLVSSGMPDDAAVFQTREAVFEARADHAAQTGDWDVAAQLYAKTNRPIETVLLSIVEACMPGTSGASTEGDQASSSSSSFLPTVTAAEKTPVSVLADIGVGPRLQAIRHMITYLVRKLDRMDTAKPMQRTIVATILVQLYSARLSSEPDERERDAVRTDFGNFLADRHSDLDTGTALGVLTRNGCLEEAWNLAVLSGDVLAACELSGRQGNVEQSLSLLTKQAVVKDADLQSRLVAALANTVMPLQPKRVAAAIARALRKDAHFAEHTTVVHCLARIAREVGDAERSENAYQAAVTYLFDLLFARRANASADSGAALASQQAGTEWQKLVTSLFVLHAEFGTEAEAQRSFDNLVQPYIAARARNADDVVGEALGAILRACASAQFDRLCVFLYQALGLFERAVHLAIALDIELAEARVGSLGDAVGAAERRALWAAVARASSDPVGVVERSKGVLHIEDVLHDMGEFDSASERIKAAVAGSLEEHKRLANQAKSEAAAALEVTAALREDVRIVEERRRQARTALSASAEKRERARSGPRAIESITAGFERGHSLPIVKLDRSDRVDGRTS